MRLLTGSRGSDLPSTGTCGNEALHAELRTAIRQVYKVSAPTFQLKLDRFKLSKQVAFDAELRRPNLRRLATYRPVREQIDSRHRWLLSSFIRFFLVLSPLWGTAGFMFVPLLGLSLSLGRVGLCLLSCTHHAQAEPPTRRRRGKQLPPNGEKRSFLCGWWCFPHPYLF